MRTRLRIMAVVAPAALATAVGTAVAAQAQRVVRSSDIITREEIEKAKVDDAYQAVLRLRPEFLQRTGHPRVRVVPAGQPSEQQRSHSEPYSPEFDAERSGRATGSSADGPVGFAGEGSSTSRSTRTATPVDQGRDSTLVYVGDAVAGGVEELTTIPARDVQEIRWLRPVDAQYRFGMRHSGAVILVTLQH